MDQEPHVDFPAEPDQAPIVEITANEPQWLGFFTQTPLGEFLDYSDSVDLSRTCRAAWFVFQNFGGGIQ